MHEGTFFPLGWGGLKHAIKVVIPGAHNDWAALVRNYGLSSTNDGLQEDAA